MSTQFQVARRIKHLFRLKPRPIYGAAFYNGVPNEIFNGFETLKAFNVGGCIRASGALNQETGLFLSFDDGSESEAEILELVPNEKIVMSWNTKTVDLSSDIHTISTVEISALPENRTQIYLVHSGFSSPQVRAFHQLYWKKILDRLSNEINPCF